MPRLPFNRKPFVAGSGEPAAAEIDVGPDLGSRALYLNRELSWLEFNARGAVRSGRRERAPPREAEVSRDSVEQPRRILHGARRRLKQQITGEVDEMGPDGMTVGEQLSAVATRVHELVAAQEKSFSGLLPRLADAGILFVKPVDLPPQALKELDERFDNEVFPISRPSRSIRAPVSAGEKQEFEPRGDVQASGNDGPHVRSGSGSVDASTPVAVTGVTTKDGQPALVHTCCSKISSLDTSRRYFPGVELDRMYVFRVTRNFDIEVDEEEAEDLSSRFSRSFVAENEVTRYAWRSRETHRPVRSRSS